jgi:DNA-binding LacI/PurR family transcriptional regulator
MSVTIKDIARATGVSHTTVSRALRNHPAIASSTTSRIQSMARQMGYLPSAVARGLKTNRSFTLGVILSRIDDPFFSEVLQGIENTLRPKGYSLLVAASQQNLQREKDIVQEMIERRVDGVILCAPPFRAEHSHTFQEYHLPITVINNQDAEDYQYSIYHDDRFGSRQVIRYLINLGHTRIAYLGNAQTGRTNQDRLAGYELELNKAGLPLLNGYIFHGSDGRPQGGYAGAKYFSSLPIPPTAIACFNDMMALGLLHGLREAGWQVPQDCSVTGFDNIDLSAFLNPPLTTFDQPRIQLGAEAARLMLRLLAPALQNTPLPEPQMIALRGHLLVRSSTAAPNQNKTRKNLWPEPNLHY